MLSTEDIPKAEKLLGQVLEKVWVLKWWFAWIGVWGFFHGVYDIPLFYRRPKIKIGFWRSMLSYRSLGRLVVRICIEGSTSASVTNTMCDSVANCDKLKVARTLEQHDETKHASLERTCFPYPNADPNARQFSRICFTGQSNSKIDRFTFIRTK